MLSSIRWGIYNHPLRQGAINTPKLDLPYATKSWDHLAQIASYETVRFQFIHFYLSIFRSFSDFRFDFSIFIDFLFLFSILKNINFRLSIFFLSFSIFISVFAFIFKIFYPGSSWTCTCAWPSIAGCVFITTSLTSESTVSRGGIITQSGSSFVPSTALCWTSGSFGPRAPSSVHCNCVIIIVI